jgi:membrane protein required for beta-lactamase induction
MAKLTAWLVTLIGVLLVLQLIAPATFAGTWFNWVVALAVLVIGAGKLMRNYKKKGRK